MEGRKTAFSCDFKDDDRASLVVVAEYDGRATLVASIRGFYIRVNWDPTDGGNSFPLNLCE